MTTATAPAQAPALNEVQKRTLEELLAFGAPRPTPRAGLVAELRQHLEDGTREAAAAWPERSLFITKAQLASVLRCEGLYKANKDQPRTRGMIPAVAQGTVVHRAIQHNNTHPHIPVQDSVNAAIALENQADPQFQAFWSGLGVAAQSDLVTAAVAMVMTFLDSWPPMPTSWSPRFEQGMQAPVGALMLSGRADLVLGRPRPDGKQSMVIVDWKSGTLYPEHQGEADFYALVSTLRFGVPPFRSFLYSLASTETTTLDVDEARLFAAADTVIKAANSIVDVMTSKRLPVLNPNPGCSWCPVRTSCTAVPQLPAAA